MEVAIIGPLTQTVIAVWVLADHGFIVDGGQKCAEMLETVTDVAIRRYHNRRIRAGQSRREPDVRDS